MLMLNFYASTSNDMLNFHPQLQMFGELKRALWHSFSLLNGVRNLKYRRGSEFFLWPTQVCWRIPTSATNSICWRNRERQLRVQYALLQKNSKLSSLFFYENIENLYGWIAMDWISILEKDLTPHFVSMFFKIIPRICANEWAPLEL